MCACFVVYDYNPSYTVNILHSKRLTYWKYVYCLFFLLFCWKKQKKYIFLKCRPLWRNRDSNPPDLTCCLSLSRFVLDSPDLFWKQGKQLLILRFFCDVSVRPYYTFLSYNFSPSLSIEHHHSVKNASNATRDIFAKFPGGAYPRSPLEAHT